MIQETNVTSAGEVEIPKFVSGVVGSKSVKRLRIDMVGTPDRAWESDLALNSREFGSNADIDG